MASIGARRIKAKKDIARMTPRTQLFVPTDVNCPIPTKYLDVLRKTETAMDDLVESKDEGFWTEDGHKELSGSLTGRTCVDLLRALAAHRVLVRRRSPFEDPSHHQAWKYLSGTLANMSSKQKDKTIK